MTVIVIITACSESQEVTESPAYLPKSGDEDLVLGGVSLDESEVLIEKGDSPKYSLSLIGHLPTPCHQLRVEILDPNEKNEVLFNVYSVSKPGEICAQVLEPFETVVLIPEFPAGEYKILVNGEQVGEISQ
ncbi:hypothetical protein ACFLUC_01225 [Chloroflexota bacterium]